MCKNTYNCDHLILIKKTNIFDRNSIILSFLAYLFLENGHL